MWKDKEDIKGWIFCQLQELQSKIGWPWWQWNPRRGHVWTQGSGAVSEWVSEGGRGSSTVSTDEANLVDRPPAQTNLQISIKWFIDSQMTTIESTMECLVASYSTWHVAMKLTITALVAKGNGQFSTLPVTGNIPDPQKCKVYMYLTKTDQFYPCSLFTQPHIHPYSLSPITRPLPHTPASMQAHLSYENNP